MKFRRLSLAQKIIVYMTAIVVPLAVLMLLVLYGYFLPLQRNLNNAAVKESVEASLRLVSVKMEFDVLTENAESVASTVNDYLKEGRNRRGMGVFLLTEAARDRVDGSLSFSRDATQANQGDFVTLYVEKGTLPPEVLPDALFSQLLERRKGRLFLPRDEARAQRKGASSKLALSPVSWFVNDYIVSGAPVISEGRVVGYLTMVQSIREATEALNRFLYGVVALLMLMVVVFVVTVFLVVRRTSRPLSALADSARILADGDLTVGISTDSVHVAETEVLAAALKDMVTALGEQVSLFKSIVGKTAATSGDTVKAMSHLASSASEQAAAVSETAITVEQMEKAGKSVAVAVNRIVDAARKSSEASTRGRASVEQANGVMVRIRDNSQNMSSHSRSLLGNVEEIGNIINSVNAIAEQSKILAVNASIEAAKAGEYGTGFAVVAQEVKSLAGQSKSATEQITHTLTSIRQAIEEMVQMAREGEAGTVKGVTAIANTGAIVNDLSEAIQEASEVANEIDASVSQQSSGLSQIVTAMDEINSSALENQDISRQIEENTVGISESLEELVAVIDIWKTK